MLSVVVTCGGLVMIGTFLVMMHIDGNTAFVEATVLNQILSQIGNSVSLLQVEYGQHVAATWDIDASLVKTGYLKKVPRSPFFEFAPPVLVSESGSTQYGDAAFVVIQLDDKDYKACAYMAQQTGDPKAVGGRIPIAAGPLDTRSGCFEADGYGGPAYGSGGYYAFMRL